MKSKTISVIIPNYNKSAFLEKCILSLEEQTEKPDEIIFVDDCSTDNSIEIIQSLQEKYGNITIICNDRNRGVSYSRNYGVKLSKSKYVCFLDSDDFLINKNFFERIKHYVNRSLMSYMLYATTNKDGVLDSRYNFGPGFVSKKISKSRMKLMCCKNLSNPLIPRCYIINKSCFLKSGMFDEDLSLYEDADVICKLMKYVSPLAIGEYGPAYRITNDGLSHVDKALHKEVLSRLSKKHLDFKCKILLFFDKIRKRLRK